MKCSECKKDFCTTGFCMKDYVYKVKSGNSTNYFCSYACYNRYLNRKEEGE